MDAKTNSTFRILKAALELFREKGFAATSVREIAAKAEVSLGMVNHYFENKEFLGTQCLSVLNAYSKSNLPPSLVLEEDPILYDLVVIRTLYQYIFENGYKEFYLDSLRQDFFFKHISNRNRPTLMAELLAEKYSITFTPDEALLYCRYMPYMMEKTLVLKKEEGLFSEIPYSHIPYMIAATAMNHFIPEKDVAARDAESIRITDELVQQLEATVPDDYLLSFAERYTERFQEANATRKSVWIQQMNGV